jgi:hypothetical protein
LPLCHSRLFLPVAAKAVNALGRGLQRELEKSRRRQREAVVRQALRRKSNGVGK